MLGIKIIKEFIITFYKIINKKHNIIIIVKQFIVSVANQWEILFDPGS